MRRQQQPIEPDQLSGRLGLAFVHIEPGGADPAGPGDPARTDASHLTVHHPVARIVRSSRPDSLMLRPASDATFAAAIDLLPDWARRMHGLGAPALTTPLVRAGTYGLAATLRWAFRTA